MQQQNEFNAQLAGLDGCEEEDITTSKKGVFGGLIVNPLKPILHPVQLQLRQVVHGLRIAKSIVLWHETYYAFWITTISFVVSAVIAWVPFGVLLRWISRISVWIALGPWMAIIDRIYFRENPKTAEQKENIVKQRFHEQLEQATSDNQIRKERAKKMKAMKKYMFGKFHLRVPRFSEDLVKDTPRPESFAKPYQGAPVQFSQRIYGQTLKGDMIPQREIQGYDHLWL
jgi:hypothetical protein